MLRNKYDDCHRADSFGRIRIGNNVHIDFNVVLMPGVTIGNNCVIGCSTIVSRDIPSGLVASGVLARVIEDINEYHDKYRAHMFSTN